jgi:hypothetical protein
VAAVAGSFAATPWCRRVGIGRAYVSGQFLASPTHAPPGPGATSGLLATAIGIRRTLILTTFGMLTGVLIALLSPSAPSKPSAKPTQTALW